MAKPYLLVVTGRPGSGKTTFARELGSEIYLPVISRDQIKEGYVHTFGKRHAELPDGTNRIATELFFDITMNMLNNHVSLIVEAAFQHTIWSALFERCKGIARIFVLICKVDDTVALERFIRRGLENPLREYFHGDHGVDLARRGIEMSAIPYDEPRLDAPTFCIDTSGEYHPTIKELARMIFLNA